MHKIHVCFFIDNSNCTIDKFSSFKSLFDKLLNDDNFKVSILKESNNISNTFNNFLNNLPSNVKIYTYHINNFNLDLARLDIDYIFTCNPYLQSYMNWNEWKKKIKICYIEYGTTFITENILKKEYISSEAIPVMGQAYRIFYENNFIFDGILKFNPNMDRNKLVVSGKPKYDYIFKDKRNIRQDLWRLNKDKNNKIKRIIWSPHCSFVPTWINSIPHSQFLKYYELWLEIPKDYPNLDIVMKPHPALFINLEKLENLGWNRKKINEWKENFLSNPNTQIIENGLYDDLFLTSDAMINDSVSFIVEYLPTLKPLLLCRNGYGKDGYSKYGENIAKAHYNAYNKEDIINFIENVVVGEKDNMLKEREKALKDNIFIPKGGSGLFIKNYLKNDYEENSSKKINLKEIFRNKYNI